MHWTRWTKLMKTVNEGSYGSMLPILNTAAEVGYGTVIASLAGFVVIRDLVLGVSSNPLISEAVAVNILAGITGSASGGMQGRGVAELAELFGESGRRRRDYRRRGSVIEVGHGRLSLGEPYASPRQATVSPFGA